MAKDLYISALLDVYGEFLSEKSRTLTEYYYNDDLSLSEIAENVGITRQGVRDTIVKASEQLSQYEEAYVDKWVMDYGYPLNVIEIALKKTTSKTNPSFDYIDKIISDWHERNLKNETEISSFIEAEKKKRKEFKMPASAISTNTNPLQKFNDVSTSQYSDLSKFYIN